MSEFHGDLQSSEVHANAAGPQMSLIGVLAFPLALTVVGLILMSLIACILKLNYGTFLYTLLLR